MKYAGRTQLIQVVASSIALSAAALGGNFSDDFESYAGGAFPAANWQDTGPIAPYGTLPPPTPSCIVDVTTDAQGLPTQALHLDSSWIGSASGIYRPVQGVAHYSLSMDVRTDVFGDGATDDPSDWPWMLGVSRFDANVQAGGWHSLMMYGTNMSRDFRGYAIDEQGQDDFPLGLSISPGVWYHVQVDADALTGSMRHRIWDSASNALLLDTTVVAASWGPNDSVFDVVTINQGELSSTSSSDAWIDNVSITVPEPAAVILLALGGLAMVRRGNSR